MKTLIIYNSIYYGNTQKIAQAIAKVLEATLETPQQIDTKKLPTYDLIGFGSGIYYNKHHQSLFDFIEKIPNAHSKKAFIFSMNRDGNPDDHKLLKDTLGEKGFMIVGEFCCKGFENWRAMKIVGKKASMKENLMQMISKERKTLD